MGEALPDRGVRMSRLLVLACSATKSSAPGLMPARNRYTGPIWQTYRAADPRGELARLTVLSARYGWIDGPTPIANYDQKMTAQPVASGSERAQQLIELGSFDDIEEICIVGGHLYQAAINPYLDAIRARYPGIVITRICDQIGFMRQQLRAWLNSAACLQVAA